MRRLPLTAAILAGMMALLGTGCDYLAARDHLNKGVASTKAGKFGDAAEHFKQAMALDPDWDAPRLYLAVSYMSQWIPGAESPENQEFSKLAKEGFLKVLETSPSDTTALASMASMAFSEATTQTWATPELKNAKLDESAEWHKKHIAVAPTAEHYYSLAVIGYTKWVPAWLAARQSVKMRQDDPGPIKDKKVRDELKEKFSAILEQGISDLQKSLELDPEYENSMAYMNLLVRERADLLEEKAEYEKATTEADGWLAKYLDTKKIKAARAAKSANSGIVQDAPAK
jgi:tetratricopeptide (TPR) repeat protein